jgi:hypothetical protein
MGMGREMTREEEGHRKEEEEHRKRDDMGRGMTWDGE